MWVVTGIDPAAGDQPACLQAHNRSCLINDHLHLLTPTRLPFLHSITMDNLYSIPLYKSPVFMTITALLLWLSLLRFLLLLASRHHHCLLSPLCPAATAVAAATTADAQHCTAVCPHRCTTATTAAAVVSATHAALVCSVVTVTAHTSFQSDLQPHSAHIITGRSP